MKAPSVFFCDRLLILFFMVSAGPSAFHFFFLQAEGLLAFQCFGFGGAPLLFGASRPHGFRNLGVGHFFAKRLKAKDQRTRVRITQLTFAVLLDP